MVSPASWSKRRLLWIVLFVAAIQLALVWHLSGPTEEEQSDPRPKTVVRFIPTSNDSATEWFYLNDPALFSLINPKGFSGAAWLRLPRFPYQLTNSIQPFSWLEASANLFGLDLDRFSQTHDRDSLLALAKPPPTVSEVRLDNNPRVVVPSVRIEGDLTDRRLVSTNPLPDGDPEKASKCIVRVAVSASGDVLSTVLWSSSGSAIADQQVEAFARNARFTPIDSDPSTVTFGFLVFNWFAGTLETRSTAMSQ